MGMHNMSMEILKVDHLTVKYYVQKQCKEIVNDISFRLQKNRCLGIVGESGSGKSMTCKALLGLLDQRFIVSGDVQFTDLALLRAEKRILRKIRGKEICMILQNPMTAFNPLYTIEQQMTETFVENLQVKKAEAVQLAYEALVMMNISQPQQVFSQYPHQLSGGMLQRVMIGIALTLKPQIIIADEPTTAVDSINVVNVLQEFIRIKQEYHTSMIFISHDLGAVAKVADDLLVMQGGRVVEFGETSSVLSNPQHNHTQYLVDTRNALVNKFCQVVG